MTTKPTPRERAVLNFWGDELPIQMLDDEPEEKPSVVWTLFRLAIGLVGFCLAVSFLVPQCPAG